MPIVNYEDSHLGIVVDDNELDSPRFNARPFAIEDSVSLDFLVNALRRGNCSAEDAIQEYENDVLQRFREKPSEENIYALACVGKLGQVVNFDFDVVGFKLGLGASEKGQERVLLNLYDSMTADYQERLLDRLYNRGDLQNISINSLQDLFKRKKEKNDSFLSRYLKAGVNYKVKEQLVDYVKIPEVLYESARHFFSDPYINIGFEPDFAVKFFDPEGCIGKICKRLPNQKLRLLENYIQRRYDCYQRPELADEALHTIYDRIEINKK